MGAVGGHHTGTDDGAWDGPGNEARLRSGEGEGYYRRAYAWQDPEGDPATKAGWRFIHHFVSQAGEPGAASTRGCSTGIGVLNGGRGGTTIPRADRRGVWKHLAAHLRDAELEPPELKSFDAASAGNGYRGAAQDDGLAGRVEVERRCWPGGGLEVREEDGKPLIVGYAAVFEQLSEDLGGWRERIRRGAFQRSLTGDVRALWNHEVALVLGRTANGTLRLDEDIHGLRIQVTPPGTQWAKDALISIGRGDVNQMSFGFYVAAQGEEWNNDKHGIVRTLTDVELLEVSPVTFPAYPQTAVYVREMARQLRARLPGAEAWLARARGLRRRLELAERQ